MKSYRKTLIESDKVDLHTRKWPNVRTDENVEDCVGIPMISVQQAGYS